MKTKMTQKIFKLSFIAYALPVVYGIYSSIAGFEFFGICYGFDAFVAGTFFSALLLCIIPIIPICLLYEIIYGIVSYFKKHNSLPPQKRKKIITICISIFILLFLIVLGTIYSYQIEAYAEKLQAKRMIKRAETEVFYCKNEQLCDGIFGLDGYTSNCMLIDYDTHEIGFLTQSSLDHFQKFKLKKAADAAAIRKEIESNHETQAIVPLPDQSGTIYTYYNTDLFWYDNTTALILEFNDGSSYYIEYDKTDSKAFSPYTELGSSEYSTYKGIPW